MYNCHANENVRISGTKRRWCRQTYIRCWLFRYVRLQFVRADKTTTIGGSRKSRCSTHIIANDMVLCANINLKWKSERSKKASTTTASSISDGLAPVGSVAYILCSLYICIRSLALAIFFSLSLFSSCKFTCMRFYLLKTAFFCTFSERCFATTLICKRAFKDTSVIWFIVPLVLAATFFFAQD